MDQNGIINYTPILIVFVLAAGLATVIIILSRIAGRNRPNKTKLMPYECGVEPVAAPVVLERLLARLGSFFCRHRRSRGGAAGQGGTGPVGQVARRPGGR